MRILLVSMVIPNWPFGVLRILPAQKFCLAMKRSRKYLLIHRDAAYKIIEAKGATYYAIALALDRICTAILKNEASVLNVSTLLTNYHGVSDVYLGVPCVVDRSGVREVLTLQITDSEKLLLNKSADKLKGLIKSIAM